MSLQDKSLVDPQGGRQQSQCLTMTSFMLIMSNIHNSHFHPLPLTPASKAPESNPNTLKTDSNIQIPQNVHPIRHNLAHPLPPGHNLKLRLQRAHRSQHNQHANLGAPRQHLKMGILLQKLLSDHRTHIRSLPTQIRRFQIQHLWVSAANLHGRGVLGAGSEWARGQTGME
jgi:hypothetical protein